MKSFTNSENAWPSEESFLLGWSGRLGGLRAARMWTARARRCARNQKGDEMRDNSRQDYHYVHSSCQRAGFSAVGDGASYRSGKTVSASDCLDRGKNHRFLGTLTVGIGLVACALVGPLCSSANAEEQPSDFEKARMKASELAEKAYGTAMKINKDVGAAIGIVRGIVSGDPFAIINVLLDLMGGDGGPPDITVRQARDEIIAEIRKVREEELVSRASSLVDRFGELIVDPENMTFEGRLENYLDDSADLFHELYTIMNNGDPARADLAYHLAPAFNTVASSRAVGLATAGLPQSTVDNVMADSLNTNLALVSAMGSPPAGYLYNAVQKNAGFFACTEDGPTISSPITGGGSEEVVTSFEMDLTKGWVVKGSSIAPQPSWPTYNRCRTTAAQTEIDSRFEADPIVFLVRSSASSQQLSFGTQ
jgi:hypothetical protein